MHYFNDGMIYIITAGGAPTNLAAREVLPGVVEVTWTEPSAPPQAGYRVIVDSTITTTATSSPLILSPLSLGGHTIQVQASSQHFPSDVVGPVQVMVTGQSADYGIKEQLC